MEIAIKEILVELYPEYVEVIGNKGVDEIIKNPDLIKDNVEQDSSLPFELAVVFESVNLAIKLIGTVISCLSYRSIDDKNMDNIKVKVIDALIPKLTEDQLRKALGSNSFDELIIAIIDKS